VLLAARAMYAGLDLLRPLLLRDNVPMLGKVVIGTIRGDLHDIGKNLVGIMLQGAGFEVIDWARMSRPPASSRRRSSRRPGHRHVGLADHHHGRDEGGGRDPPERGCRGQIKTIVGGAPVSADFAREIGADDYAFDAASAVTHIKALLGVA